MSLVALVYVSFASNRQMNEHELEEILNEARHNNKALDVTGMLLYRNGLFVQTLEGDENVISDLYNKIAKDKRHKRCMVLYKNAIAKRNFDDWSMGFHVIDDERLKSIDGFTDFVDKPIPVEFLKDNLSHVRTLLNIFSRLG
ncbi:MAG: BLUF domain-containing protein [Chloroflexota bacterium]